MEDDNFDKENDNDVETGTDAPCNFDYDAKTSLTPKMLTVYISSRPVLVSGSPSFDQMTVKHLKSLDFPRKHIITFYQ